MLDHDEMDIGNSDVIDCYEFNDLESRVEQLEGRSNPSRDSLSIGYALGMAIAVVLSWSRNASILWCIFHGFLSWTYVIYFALTR